MRQIRVNIVPSESVGWIMGRLIGELSEQNGWPVGDFDNNADVNFFVNYHAARPYILRNTTVTSAWFTHPESAEFFKIAEHIDIKICHAARYANLLGGHAITPGIDDLFKPILRLGVVGRTYNSGRKGEFLIEHVQQLDWVELVHPKNITEFPNERAWLKSLVSFYSSLDALLVTSLVEGGPIPAAEAIRCGVSVIAPDIGNLELFPTQKYRKGDFESLVTVLRNAYKEKSERPPSTEHLTWENFTKQVESVITTEFVRLKDRK
jgi:glycosyltransferase involved in cell wall biosynthesis